MDKGTLEGRNYPLLNQSEVLSVSQIENRLTSVIQSVKKNEDELEKN